MIVKVATAIKHTYRSLFDLLVEMEGETGVKRNVQYKKKKKTFFSLTKTRDTF